MRVKVARFVNALVVTRNEFFVLFDVLRQYFVLCGDVNACQCSVGRRARSVQEGRGCRLEQELTLELVHVFLSRVNAESGSQHLGGVHYDCGCDPGQRQVGPARDEQPCVARL